MGNRGRHRKIKIIDVTISNTPLKIVTYTWYKDRCGKIRLKEYKQFK